MSQRKFTKEPKYEIFPYENSPEQNLPETNEPFYGRNDTLQKLKKNILSNLFRVISINGPPAFGKSALAIKLGHELRKYVHTVRYVDTESTRLSWYLCIPRKAFHSSVETNAMINSRVLSDSYYNSGSGDDENLCNWSQKLKRRTLLILDNCDHILRSNHRREFLKIIKKLFQIKQITVVVTSQEKLSFVDKVFHSINVKELSVENSRKMLQSYVTDLSDKEADELAFVVGYCPLALKVVGKLLVQNSIKYFSTLLRNLQERVVDTLSNHITLDEERFRAIMNISYNQMDQQTQKCALLFSLFPGSISHRLEKNILSPIINFSCISDVVRISFIEETFINGKTRHNMHKLIRNYFKSDHYYAHEQKFNTSFINVYSNYLKDIMKKTYAKSEINDEDVYKFFYLETHNIEFFGTAVVYTNKTKELKIKSAVALGMLIQENYLDGLTTSKQIFLEAYHSFKNVSVFAELCSLSAPEVCANILWSIVVSIGSPECTAHSSNLSNILSFLIYFVTPSLTWYDDDHFCSVLLDCTNFQPFAYDNTINRIIYKPSEKPLYDIVANGVTSCGWYWMAELSIFKVLQVIIVFKSFYDNPRGLALPMGIFIVYGIFVRTILVPEVIDHLVRLVHSFSPFVKTELSTNIYSYKHFQLTGSISKCLYLFALFYFFLPNFIPAFYIEVLSALFCVVTSTRIFMKKFNEFHYNIVFPLFFLINVTHSLMMFTVPLYLFRRFGPTSEQQPFQLPGIKKCIILLAKMVILLPFFFIIVAFVMQNILQSMTKFFAINQQMTTDPVSTVLSLFNTEGDNNIQQ